MDNRKRLGIQGAAALIQNANFKGFFTGRIYTGQGKRACVPGLNCYSCPGALGSCPLGSLQNALSAKNFRFPYYVVGLMVFFGALLGRTVCGLLCPFGLLQDLLDLIPVKKIKKVPGDRHLRKVKYGVLLVTVLALPVAFKLTPFFCKYVCPSGTVSGLLLLAADSSLGQVLGGRWAWKVSVLAAVLILSVKLYRPFCRYVCPLGAFYGLFNRFSAFGITVDADRCVKCGGCAAACGMGVDPVSHPDSAECIRCGKCAAACPQQAISCGFRLADRKKEEA